MPSLPPKPCSKARCTKYATKDGRCDEHQRVKWDHTKSRHERGYDNKWYKLRKSILKRDGHLCVICYQSGIFREAKEVDHITPKAEGGTDCTSNLQSLCKKCHKEKTKQESIRGRNSLL
jgi:5-methylcytosine-specific restriction protein A